MEFKLIAWILALCLGFILWLIIDFKTTTINYEIHHYLRDPKTNTTKKPSEVMEINKILNVTDSYIDSTNSIERLHDLVYNLNIENPLYIDQMYSSEEQLNSAAWPVADANECGQQLRWILGELRQLNTSYTLVRGRRGYELAQLIGSIGKPESGLFSSGLVTWLGSYDRCQKLSMRQTQRHQEKPLNMRYCWSRMRPIGWPKNETIYPPAVIRVGTCLPESCDTRSSQAYAKEISQLIKFEWPQYYAETLEFESMFCLPDERSPIRQLPSSSRLFLYSLSAWLALVIAATIVYEINQSRKRHIEREITSGKLELLPQTSGFSNGVENKQERQQQQYNRFELLIEALSIHCSIKRFKTNRFRFKYSEARFNQAQRPRVDLRCFDFFKISMAMLIVLGHGAYMGTLYSRSLANRLDMNTGFYGSLTLCIGRFVDTFFIFFGVLTSYNMMRKFSDQHLANPLVWLGVNLRISFRVAPIFMLVYGYARLVAPYTASGPWWDYGVMKYSMRGACINEPWWKSIPYFGCVGSPSISPCVPPAWFIVSYSQISLILPLIIYIIIKLPNRYYCRQLLLAFFASVSVFHMTLRLATQTTVDGKLFVLYGGFIVDLLEKFESSGQMSTLGRVGCVSIGCYVGYLLRLYELGEITQWPKWLKWRLTLVMTIILSFLVILLPLVGYFASLYTQRVSNGIEEVIVVNSLCIILWPILNSILIICGTTIYNHIAWARFFSHSFWHAFNRLGLCIYLIHWEILTYGLTSYEQGPSNGYVMDAVKLWAYSSIFTILIAFAIHILIETPISELLEIMSEALMRRRHNEKSSMIEHSKVQNNKTTLQQVDAL